MSLKLIKSVLSWIFCVLREQWKNLPIFCFVPAPNAFLKSKSLGAIYFSPSFVFFHFLFSYITVLRFWTESHQWGKKVKKKLFIFHPDLSAKATYSLFFVLSELPFLCNLSFEEVVQVHPAKNGVCPSAWDKSRQFLSVRAVGIPMLHGSSSWGHQQQQGNAKNSSCCISLTRCCLQGLMLGSEEERGQDKDCV